MPYNLPDIRIGPRIILLGHVSVFETPVQYIAAPGVALFAPDCRLIRCASAEKSVLCGALDGTEPGLRFGMGIPGIQALRTLDLADFARPRLATLGSHCDILHGFLRASAHSMMIL